MAAVYGFDPMRLLRERDSFIRVVVEKVTERAEELRVEREQALLEAMKPKAR